MAMPPTAPDASAHYTSLSPTVKSSTPPRRPQRSTLRLSVYRSSAFSSPSDDPLTTKTTSSPLRRTSSILDFDSPRSSPGLLGNDTLSSSPAQFESVQTVRSGAEFEVLSNSPSSIHSPMEDTPGTPDTPTVQRPALAQVRGSRGRRKPVPSMLDGSDEFGSLSIDTNVATQNSLGSAPLSGGGNGNMTPANMTPSRHSIQPTPCRPSTDPMALLDDDAPLPVPQRPRGQSESSLSVMSMLSAASQSRPYILPVDPPHHRGSTPPPSPPVSPTPPGSSCHHHTGSQNSHPASTANSINSHAPFFSGLPRYSTFELHAATDGSLRGDRSRSCSRDTPALAFGVEPDMHERLPRYENKPRTEPLTLAATLWKWGFFFPPFWFIGMFM